MACFLRVSEVEIHMKGTSLVFRDMLSASETPRSSLTRSSRGPPADLARSSESTFLNRRAGPAAPVCGIETGIRLDHWDDYDGLPKRLCRRLIRL